MSKYCESIYSTKRWKTREVLVGKVGVGGNNPVRIQSMTTSSTRDVDATIDQIMKLADYGCEIARVTVQGKKEAESCEFIKNGLLRRGYDIPLVADIHFYPPAAMMVADFVDKVRVNPGNYVDRRASFKIIEYDNETYAAEIEKIAEGFSPLVEKCKKLKRAMRIGTNHGSLSDRIMNRYGDTPRGMVESALEFARVCQKLDFHDFIFSMKASNPVVMVEAYRMLVSEMMKLGWDYPLHLGVTEAGEGEDGRVKSAMGTGTLLLDGLGDTIRVSLTEDPWKEIDPCKRLVSFSKKYAKSSIGFEAFEEKHRDFQNIKRRIVDIPKTLHRDGSVILKVKPEDLLREDFYALIGCKSQLGRPEKTLSTVDALILDEIPKEVESVIATLDKIGIKILSSEKHENCLLIENLENFSQNAYAVLVQTLEEEKWKKFLDIKPKMILLNPSSSRIHHARKFFDWLQENKLNIPVIFFFDYSCDLDDLIIQAATECGALLCDGLGEGIALQTSVDFQDIYSLSFSILQGARMRTTKTDFISCPGCGRTLFDLQEVTKQIRAKTGHLPGVKIAVMGCIVNGPGEMADADFGYVGSRPGKIDLYVGKKCVQRGIDDAEACDSLIQLIKDHGRWVEMEAKYEESAALTL